MSADPSVDGRDGTRDGAHDGTRDGTRDDGRGPRRPPAIGAPAGGPLVAGADAAHLLTIDWARLSAAERRTIERVLRRETVAENAVAAFEDRRSFGERLADRVASFGGSWTFIILFGTFLAAWSLLNTEILGPRHAAFDPYPYIFLNLLLSMLAAIQAPLIMMSQNRQAQRDRYDAAADYAVNLKAELEIQRLHDRLDTVCAHLGVADGRRAPDA